MQQVNLNSRQIEEMFSSELIDNSPSRSGDVRSEALRVLAEIHDRDPAAAIIIIMHRQGITNLKELSRITKFSPQQIISSLVRSRNSDEYIFKFVRQYLPDSSRWPESSFGKVFEHLAGLCESKPIALRIILNRIIYPASTHRKTAAQLGVSKPTVTKAITWLYQKYPDMAGMIGCRSPRSRAQRIRQEKGARSKSPGITYDRREKRWIARKRINGKNIRIATGQTEYECYSRREAALRSFVS